MEKPKIREYSEERALTRVKSLVEKIQTNQAILFSVTEEQILNDLTLILKSISTQEPIIYVSLRQDHNDLVKLFNNLNPNRFFYISPFSPKKSAANCKHITKPSDLNSIKFSIENWNKEIKGEKFLIFDSISTLLVYHKKDTALRFIHNLINELDEEIKAIFIINQEDLEKNKNILTFFPEIVEI